MVEHWTTAHQEYVDWFIANGYVQGEPGGNWEIAWSTRVGYDATQLEFWPWTNRAGAACVDAIVGLHASGENPRLPLGTCESLDDVQAVHAVIQRINGYRPNIPPSPQEQAP